MWEFCINVNRRVPIVLDLSMYKKYLEIALGNVNANKNSKEIQFKIFLQYSHQLYLGDKIQNDKCYVN